MDKHRIYQDKITIDDGKVRGFYNRQASMAENPLGAAFLGEQDSAVLEEKNIYTKTNVIPKLQINRDTRILDLGCGVGRMAVFVLPQCGFYCGVDFSEKMVEKARSLCGSITKAAPFQIHCMSVMEAVLMKKELLGGPFEVVILSGVLMYLNDAEVQQIVQALPDLLAQKCVIYWGDPVGIGKRLTLNNYFSESFQMEYSAIYRTVEEYTELFQPLMKTGFSIKEQRYMPKFGETYTDTGRYYMLLER